MRYELADHEWIAINRSDPICFSPYPYRARRITARG